MNCRTCAGPCCLKGSNIEGDCEGFKPMTNADRIRAMSVEEMAAEMTAKGGCPHDCETPDDMDTDCLQCWLGWLRQEADHE